MKNSEKSLNTVSWVAGITAIAAAMLLVVLLLLSLAGRIHPRKTTIHLYTPDLSQVYDETMLTVSPPEIRGGGLHEGHVLSVLAQPEYSRVGEYPNAPEYVILDETGADVTDQYAIIEEFGTIRITPCKITLSSPASFKVYDGEPLTPSPVKLTAGRLVAGHTLEAGGGNELVMPGAETAAPQYRILDAGGRDVTDQYEINENFGTLTVHPIPLTLTTESQRKQYDGKPLTAGGWKHADGQLLEGHRLEMTVTAALTQVGAVENQGTARVVDAQGKDVTELYELVYQFGTLEVTGIPLYITTGSAKKEYDGKPLQSQEWTLTGGTLAAGETLHVRSAAVCESVGTVENRMEFAVTAADGTDVTDIYQIHLSCGNLTIQPRAITIRTGSAQKVYDGTPLSCESYTITAGSLCPGDTLSISYTSITEVGYSENFVIQCAIYRAEDGQSRREVTECYRISYDFGVLKITAG